MRNLLIVVSVFTIMLFTYNSYSDIKEENSNKEQFIKNLTAQMNESYADINKPIASNTNQVKKK